MPKKKVIFNKLLINMKKKNLKDVDKKKSSKGFLENLSITVLANGFGFLVSVLTTFLLPIILDDTQYGYWHFYLLYSGYTLYFSLGLTDGVYLRHGGEKIEDLNKPLMSGQFYILILLNIFLDFALVLFSLMRFTDLKTWYMVIYACIAGLIAVPRSLVTLLMQATNHFKNNAIVVFIERGFFALGIIFLFFIKDAKVEYFIFMDLTGKLLAAIYAYVKYAKLIFVMPENFLISIREAWAYIKTGIHVVLASLSSILTLNILREAIVSKWGMEAFGNVSLSISISNMFIVFINAVAIVLFPTLRRIGQDKLSDIYSGLECLFVCIMGLFLLFFSPAQYILQWILPNKIESIKYLSLLFPLFLFEGKNSLLLSTYFKVMRKEKTLFLVNVFTIIISLIISQFLPNLTFAVLAILLVQIFRAVLSEIFLGRYLQINVFSNILLELFLAIAFLLFNNYFGNWQGMIFYAIAYIAYLLFTKKRLLKSIRFFNEFRSSDS